jgi:hypothetical protein
MGVLTALEHDMKHVTIRNLPIEVAEALEEERLRSRRSLNQTVIDLLGRALGVTDPGEKRNGLAKLAGTWTQEDFERFNEAVSVTEQIDEELWR